MTIFQVAILGAVQGLTEFFPVSSSGHLVIARLFFGIKEVDGSALDAFLHLGTLLAVLLYYWRVWWGITRGLFVKDVEGGDKRELMAKIAVATVPAAVVGYLGQDFVAGYFRGITPVAYGLFATAVVLLFSDVLVRHTKTIARASFVDAAWIGIIQVVALLPGVSRSGSTISAGLWRGLSRSQAANFSFLMSAPIIAGAGLSGFSSLFSAHDFSWQVLVVGFAVSFLVGMGAIHLLLSVVKRVSFVPFVVYLVLLGSYLLYVA